MSRLVETPTTNIAARLAGTSQRDHLERSRLLGAATCCRAAARMAASTAGEGPSVEASW
jgi:hypothetical protein